MLQLKNIRKTYATGTSPVLRSAALKLAHAQTLALVGPSGCGKSTLLRIIAGFEHPDDGEVWIAGQLVSGKATWVRPENRDVGLVFQQGALFPHMTVARNIAYGLHKLPRADRRERVNQLLELTRMKDLHARYPHQLSGGEQQRVAIARALAPQPHLLLLDEPFSHLDTNLRHDLRVEIRHILDTLQITTLLVTHDTQDAVALQAETVTLQHLDP